MPRDANGNHTLPSGNPVTPGFTIASAWANPTMSDLSGEVTDSLSRTGKGGMQAVLNVQQGTEPAPAITFGGEGNTGLRRAGAGDLRAVVGGADALIVTTGATQSVPVFRVPDGAVSGPAVAFQAEQNSGLYRAGAGDIRIAALGADLLSLSAAVSSLASPLNTQTLTVTGDAAVSGKADITGKLTGAALACQQITGLADQTASTVTPPSTTGLILVWVEGISAVGGLASYRNVASTEAGRVQDIASTVFTDFVGTPLTGTTGTNGNVTVGVKDDNTIDVENRTGVAVNVGLVFLAL